MIDDGRVAFGALMTALLDCSDLTHFPLYFSEFSHSIVENVASKRRKYHKRTEQNGAFLLLTSMKKMRRLGVTGTFLLGQRQTDCQRGIHSGQRPFGKGCYTRKNDIAARPEPCGRQHWISGAPKRKVAFTARSFRLRISFQKYPSKILPSWLAF